MRYDWSISLSGPLNSKVCFDRQNVSGRTLWNTFKGKVRKWTKRTKLRSRYPRLSSWILRDFGGKQATNGEDEHDEDNSTRELNDVIAAERSSNKKKKTKKTKCEWKTFEGFADSRQMDILMKERTHCCSRKAPWQFLKMPPSKMLASTNQTVFQAFEKAYSSYLRLARLSLYVHSSKSLAK